MNAAQLKKQLHELADEKRRKSNENRGIERSIGVPMGKLRPLVRQADRPEETVHALWQDGVMEEQLLAALIMEPDRLARDVLKQYVLTTVPQVVDEIAFRTGEADFSDWKEGGLGERFFWMHRAARAAQGELPEPALFEEIRTRMKHAPKVLQEGMNRLLVESALRSEALLPKVYTIAEEIGHWDDRKIHPGCVGTYAIDWIESVKKKRKS